ncbi:hypothetical protein wNo_07480 [Wolbachia endosymbiont of Drosophila simulans wNo]|uniref:hypothetical protein n=1 Tax=unclassified Wolbachia TaxID=2640676 RepID=UPI0002D255B1|nr:MULTISPECIES: hypothetical protein [unclassified Wolbachia]AGJ99144.1 hypothetical protein wNo_07480 [Wolbachia endosymbiont of Drosophila simulans wNo]QCB62244.1 hypothetical protein EJA99_00915 [Wolbachia endosymbiont of Drosophila mauritiana]QCB63291.1 hypothetical protein EJB00_00915 [Wolbachia endosymbiont of Drosophila mauritiana]QWE33446.1 Uncharacterized protein WwMa_05420 [Wolbachia endosymbiont of Drosophila simulans]TGB07713.1 hypothetical protein E5C28_00620 [Wolbachia endosymbi
MAKDESNKKSILAKIKGVFFLVPKALIYPIKKPFASIDEMKHDAKVSLKNAVSDVPKEEEKYDPPIKTTEASKYLGIQIIKQEKGKVSFLASRTLTGDIPYLSPEKLDEIREDLPNITIFREENKIVIEVDVEKIIQEIKDKNLGMDEKVMKKYALEGIYNKIDCDLKNLAKITGGEFKVHTDRKLLYGIAEKLYSGYDSKKQKSQEVVRPMDKEKSSEKILNNWQKAIKQDFESCESIRGRGK